MQFPDFGFRSTSHVRLTPDERPEVDDGLISTAWRVVAGRIRPAIEDTSRITESTRCDVTSGSCARATRPTRLCPSGKAAKRWAPTRNPEAATFLRFERKRGMQSVDHLLV